MTRWLCLLVIVFLGCAHSPNAGKVTSERPQTYGWSLLERRCQSCHALPNPGKFSSARWERGIARMMVRMQLPAADWDTLMALVPPDSARP